MLNQEEVDELRKSVKLNIARDEMFLGHTSLDFTPENVFAPKIGITSYEGGMLKPKQFRYGIVGLPGAGKTWLLRLICQEIMRNYQCPTFLMTPATELHYWQRPITSVLTPTKADQVMQYLSQWGLKPMGFPGEIWKPKFESEREEIGVSRQDILTLQDFRDLKIDSFSNASKELETVLGVELSEPAARDVHKILNDKRILVFSDINKLSKSEELEFESNVITSAIKDATDTGVIGDSRPDNSNILADLRDRSYVVYKGMSRDDADDPQEYSRYLAFPRIRLNQTINDRKAAVSGTKSEQKRAYLGYFYGLNIGLDEVQVFAPYSGASFTRSRIRNVYLQNRKDLIHMGWGTQDLSLIATDLHSKAEALFIFRVEESSEDKKNGTIDVLKKRLPPATIRTLRNLPHRVQNSLGFTTSQCALWYPQRPLGRENPSYFYPGLGLSAAKIN